jgi:CheY-like chemotaxis protein
MAWAVQSLALVMAKRKILLVDDSSTALMIEGMLLGRAPYDVVTARDGREAVAKARSEHPDLILMDVMMPNMTGI